MARPLSLRRRRANLVDLTLPVRAGVISYQFQSATNFDGSFTTFDTVSSSGKASKSVGDMAYEPGGFRGLTRFVFNPTDYALDDTKPLWVRIRPITSAGVGTAEAAMLVLPYLNVQNRTVVIAGTAPTGADQAAALELQLPGRCTDFVFKSGAESLLLSFEAGGSEIGVFESATFNYTMSLRNQTSSQIFVRSAGAPIVFEAIMTLLKLILQP